MVHDDDPSQIESNPDQIPAHDHSSSEQGGDRLNPSDIVLGGPPTVDVREYGVMGDGETDDSAALQAAVDAATPHGALYVPPSLTVNFEQPIDINLTVEDGEAKYRDYLPGRESLPRVFESWPQSRFSFVCEGALHPAPGLGDAIHIHHGWYPYVSVRIEGGGKDVNTDTAIRVTDMVGGLFEAYANRYAGTVYQFDQGEAGTVAISIGQLHTDYCGQALAVVPGPHADTIAGFGELRYAFDIAPVRCPEFRNVMDISVNHYENWVAEGRTEQGMIFDDCFSIWVNKIAVGGDADIPLAEFRKVNNSHINSLHVGATPNVGVIIDDAQNTMFRILAFINDVGIEYGSSEGIADSNRIVFNARNNASAGLIIREDVSRGYHYFSGNVVETAEPVEDPAGDDGGGDIPEHFASITGSEPGIEVRTTDAEIHLDAVHGARNHGPDLVLPIMENEVRLTNTDLPTIEGQPKTINHVGQTSGSADTLDERDWHAGDVIATTPEDASDDDGVYLKLPDGSWRRLS